MIDALAAFYSRVAPDATLQGIIGVKASGKARVYPEFPDETLVEADYPRATYFLISEERPGPTLLIADIQVDEWVWPSGATGGPSKLAAVDNRLLVLLNGDPPNPGDAANAGKGVAWSYSGARVFSREVGARDFPTEPGAPLRRRRTYRLTVS